MEINQQYKKVAIIHYWLVNMRGGEKVVEELCRMFPEADIFTHVYDPHAVSDLIRSRKVTTSFINRLPFAKKWYQNYLPLMSRASGQLDLRGYDLVISTESGPSKGVVTDPEAFHLCCCFSPMRYIWDMSHDYLESLSPLKRTVFRWFIPSLRRSDLDSTYSVDHFVSISRFIKDRVRRIYRRDSSIVFPPVEVEKFVDQPRAPEDFYLFYGQLVDYKRVDLAIEGCRIADKKLVIIGGGTPPAGLPDNVVHLGFQSDEVVADHLSRAKALLFPGTEDFGIVPVEAIAAGCPVIAYNRGGARDTVTHEETGILFPDQSPQGMADAILDFESRTDLFNNREVFSHHAEKFSVAAFQDGISACLGKDK